MKEFTKFMLEYWPMLLGSLVTIVSWILGLIAAIKKKQWNKVAKMTLDMMKKAENFTHYSGEEKKAFVMTSVNRFAMEKRYGFNSEKVSDFIEKSIEATKRINRRAKDPLIIDDKED